MICVYKCFTTFYGISQAMLILIKNSVREFVPWTV